MTGVQTCALPICKHKSRNTGLERDRFIRQLGILGTLFDLAVAFVNLILAALDLLKVLNVFPDAFEDRKSVV